MTSEGRQFAHNPAPLLRQMRAVAPKVKAQRNIAPEVPIPVPIRGFSQDSLSPEETEILIAAAEKGEISLLSSDETGAWVRAGRRDFANHSDPAVAAMYVQALKSLCRRELVTHAGGIAYDLTGSGFQLARQLKQRAGEQGPGAI